MTQHSSIVFWVFFSIFPILVPLTYIVFAGEGITGTIRGQRSCHANTSSFPEEKDIYKNTDVAPSLLLLPVARHTSKPAPAILNPPNARETTNIRAQVSLMDAGASRHRAVGLTLNKIRGKHQAPAWISKYIFNKEAL